MTIGIIDYGAGNLMSVRKAFDFLGYSSLIVSAAKQLQEVDRLVLPGVGAFGPAAERLRLSGLSKPIRTWIAGGRPLLGICLGLQLLFDGSGESPGIPGLGLLSGQCRRIRTGKVPLIGWNRIRIQRESPLFRDIGMDEHFYFVHSWYVVPDNPEAVLAAADHPEEYVCAVEYGRTSGVQFHPEKSGRAGLRLLANWIEQC